ncbi:MAG TPA: ATP-binding protein [Solirubrobacteraceae bacterium]|nr:ATP-binding protein [Solirubrobacteraceae bacterium]
MTGRPEPAGLLMHDAWRADIVLAHRIEIAGGRYAPGRVRNEVGELLADRLEALALLDVNVLVSELVTNAVRHGGTDAQETITIHVAVAPHVLRIEVCDQGPGFTPPDIPLPREEGGGNGLVLLSRMSSSWGVACDDGTCVWFERMLAPKP